MKETFAIKENRTFQFAYKRGGKKVQKYLTVYAVKCTPRRDGTVPGSRLGITVSKKFGNSVQRNTFKRYVRECYRAAEKDFNASYSIVVTARPSVRTAVTPNRKLKAEAIPSYDDVRADMFASLRSLGVIGEKTNQK